MTKRPKLTVSATITVDGKLDSGADPAELRRWFEEGLVGEIYLTVRPKIDGRRCAATLAGGPGKFFPASVRCRLLKMEVRGDECLLHYRVLRTRAKRMPGAST